MKKLLWIFATIIIACALVPRSAAQTTGSGNPTASCSGSLLNTYYVDSANNQSWVCNTAGWRSGVGLGTPASESLVCANINYGNSYTDLTNNLAYFCTTSGWVATSSGGSSFTAAGDLSGTNTSQTVIGINGTLLSGLATGLIVNTTTTGVPTVTVPGAGVLAFIATPSSANLATAVIDETGSGSLVFGTAPTITLANGTGLPISTGVSGLGTGVAAFLATPSSANLATAVTDETGTGSLVFAGGPTFTGQIAAATGACSTSNVPYSFTSATGSGMYFTNSSGIPAMCTAGSATMAFTAGGQVTSTGLYKWSNSGTITGAADTALSRDSAGIVDVGTGAAASAAGAIKSAGHYTTQSLVAAGASTTTAATTLATPGANSSYLAMATVNCLTGTGTVTLKITYTDTSTTAQTIQPAAAACTTLGSASIAMINSPIRAKSGVAIQVTATLAGTATYDLSAYAMQLTPN